METITVIYDDTCNLCRYLIAQLRELSRESSAKFVFVGASQKEVSYLGVSEGVYAKEICVLSNGKLYTGHYAIGFILSKLPQLRYRLLGYAIKAASVAIAAGYIYRTISRYRSGSVSLSGRNKAGVYFRIQNLSRHPILDWYIFLLQEQD